MTIDILTIFPAMFAPVLNESVLKRAQLKGLVTINVHDLRKWTNDKHKTVDDRPFGGGPGMVLKSEPIFKAVEELVNKKNKNKINNLTMKQFNNDTKIILLSPQGRTFTQAIATEYSHLDHLILICGRYEGVDQRVIDHLIDNQLSVGNYVLTGGELPAMIVVDAITRLIPGVLGNPDSLVSESFNPSLDPNPYPLNPPTFDYPVYTQPADFRGMKVPEVLKSGNHQQIASWRQQATQKS